MKSKPEGAKGGKPLTVAEAAAREAAAAKDSAVPDDRKQIIEGQHTILIVEDEPAVAHGHIAVLDELGLGWIWAMTRAEAERVVAEEKAVCAMLLDLQLPHGPAAPGKKPLVSSKIGFGVLRFARGIFPRKDAFGIVVVSGHAADHDNVVEAMKLGANDFSPKSVQATRRTLSSILEEVLEETGRSSHRECASRRRLAMEEGTLRPRIRVTGKRKGRRVIVHFDDAAIPMRVESLAALLGLAVGLKREGDHYRHENELGATDDGWQGFTRLKKDLTDVHKDPDEYLEMDFHSSMRIREGIRVAYADSKFLRALGNPWLTSALDELESADG